jgi:hypothetical protein
MGFGFDLLRLISWLGSWDLMGGGDEIAVSSESDEGKNDERR